MLSLQGGSCLASLSCAAPVLAAVTHSWIIEEKTNEPI